MLGTWLDLDAALIKVDEREEREQSSWLVFFQICLKNSKTTSDWRSTLGHVLPAQRFELNGLMNMGERVLQGHF